MKDAQNRTRGSLGKLNSQFLGKVGVMGTFTSADARRILNRPAAATASFLNKLEAKGWIRSIKRGHYAVVPLSSGDQPTPQLHEFVVAMQLVAPAAVAYWSALNHHGMTEQLPRTVFVATNHRVRRPTRDALGMAFQIVCLRPARFFGVVQDWVGEQSFMITDREKTIVDGLDLPAYVGGVGEVAKALALAWKEIDQARLFEYAHRIGNAAVVKRLGFLLEALGLEGADKLRGKQPLAAGYPSLDPTLPRAGRHNRRWGLLINTEVPR